MHAWVKVYFENIGWVPFDTTRNEQRQQSPLSNKQGLYDLPNKYVYFTHIRNDQSLHNGFIRFGGHIDGDVDLKPSIKFKKPIYRVYEGP